MFQLLRTFMFFLKVFLSFDFLSFYEYFFNIELAEIIYDYKICRGSGKSLVFTFFLNHFSKKAAYLIILKLVVQFLQNTCIFFLIEKFFAPQGINSGYLGVYLIACDIFAL